MMESTILLASELMQGTLRGGDAAFRGISTDSRAIRADELFFALQGRNYDGSEFLPEAAAARAAGAVVGKSMDAALPTLDLPTIEVPDTRRALGTLAAAWRRQMPAVMIGLTGSNGKTTCKELIAACLASGAPTLATRGNLNNDIGVPLMLAEIAPEHRFAVIELGANHPGEIAWLTSLVAPQIAVITNAAAAHLEGFGSIEGVARAKGEILQGEARPEWAVLNVDDDYFSYWKSLASDLRVIGFGLGENADVRAVDVHTTASGSVFRLVTPADDMRIALPLPGRHNVLHASAAAAVAIALGVGTSQIRQGLEAVKPVSGRLNPLPGIAGITVFDDSYNANPASVIAAAEFLAARNGQAWLVLGDMGELGGASEKLHRAVGDAAKKAGIDRLYATGALSRHTAAGFGADAAWFETVDELVQELGNSIESDAAESVNVLVKGSRAMQMERVVKALTSGSAVRGEV